jgi:hypothetical protein
MKKYFEIKFIQQYINGGIASHKMFDMRRCENKDTDKFFNKISDDVNSTILKNNYCPDLPEDSNVTL